MRKLFIVLTTVCLLGALTIVNAIPVSADTLTITPPVGGPQDPEEPQPPEQPSPSPGPDPGPIIFGIEIVIPDFAGDNLSGLSEQNLILEDIFEYEHDLKMPGEGRADPGPPVHQQP
jgi:hypothetical protein